MKKQIALLSVLALSLSLLAACGKPAENPSTPPSSSQEVSDAPSQEPSAEPTQEPSQQPSDLPTEAPSEQPSTEPSEGLPTGGDTVDPALTLSMKDATITYAGYVLKLKPTFTGTKDSDITWTSSDESVATVDKDGNVTSVAPGKAVILARASNGLEASCIVRCNWKENEDGPAESTPPSSKPEGGVDLSAFSASTQASYEFGFLQLADQEMLDNYYAGLSGISTEQCLVYVCQMSMNNGEFALIQVSDSGDVAAVKAILQARIDYMAGDGENPGGAWYPGPTEMWKNNSTVVSNGNYVMMVVHEDYQAIVDQFNALF